MIQTFGDSITEDLFHGRQTSRIRHLPKDIITPAIHKLDMLNAAQNINDLRSPPSNHLEQLRGNLTGYYSIRINDRYRLVFRWENNEAYEVTVNDYH